MTVSASAIKIIANTLKYIQSLLKIGCEWNTVGMEATAVPMSSTVVQLWKALPHPYTWPPAKGAHTSPESGYLQVLHVLCVLALYINSSSSAALKVWISPPDAASVQIPGRSPHLGPAWSTRANPSLTHSQLHSDSKREW